MRAGAKSMRIELKCADCGGNNFRLGDEFEENAEVTCDDCGHRIGSMAELKQHLADEVMRRARPAHSG